MWTLLDACVRLRREKLMNELLPCPFCNGEARLVTFYTMEGSRQGHIKCDKCGAMSEHLACKDMGKVEEELEALWNKRAERTCHITPMDAAGNPPYRKGDIIYNSLTDGCSKCGYPFDTLNHGEPNYCPNCGAKVWK